MGPNGIHMKDAEGAVWGCCEAALYQSPLKGHEDNVHDDWEKANAAPFFRKDKEDYPGNYRLFSLTFSP